MNPRLIAAGLAFAAVLAAGPAAANGRYPAANRISFSPGEPGLVYLRVTFGLLVSHDRGTTWDWVCEPALGVTGIEDPMLAATPNGTSVATTFGGLSVSSDRACTWGFASGALTGRLFVDLTQSASDGKNVIAMTGQYAGLDASTVLFSTELFETTDEAKTWKPLGAAIDPTFLGYTVDIAPSDPQRIYLSVERDPGTATRAVSILTSHDHAASYTAHPLALIGDESTAYIAGIDPKNPDRLYVRTDSATQAATRLLVSDDAGATFRVIFAAPGPITGFALSPDGNHVFVGGGTISIPTDGGPPTTSIIGLHRASTTDFSFVKQSSIEIGCLAYGTDGLWACSTEASGFIAGLSTDEGATFQAKAHFCSIRGPLACAVGTSTHDQCTVPWPAQRSLLGCDLGDASVAVDAGMVSPPTMIEASGSGCSCRAANASPFGAALAVLGLGVLGLRRRRAR